MSYAYYLKHDYYARQDPKMQHLLATHGVAGVGLFWCIIEQLFEQGGTLPMSSVNIIAWQLHCDIKFVESVINDFNLFVSDGESFWSESAKTRLEEMKSKSETNRKNAKKKYEKKQSQSDGTTTAEQSQSDGTTTELPLKNDKNRIDKNRTDKNRTDDNKKEDSDTSDDVSYNATPSVDALREKSSWIENVAMNYGLTTQGVHEWLDRFNSEVINCKLKTHANQKDLASHFCDWLRIKLADQRPQSRMQATNDKMTAYIQSLSN